MNAGTDLFTLMREITPPPELALGRGARQGDVERARDLGGVRRVVPLRVHHRAVRGASARGLRGSGRARGWPRRARERAPRRTSPRAGRSRRCTSPTWCSTRFPNTRSARETALAAHALLLERSGAANLSENRWLESEIAAARAALARRRGEGLTWRQRISSTSPARWGWSPGRTAASASGSRAASPSAAATSWCGAAAPTRTSRRPRSCARWARGACTARASTWPTRRRSSREWRRRSR